MKSEFVGQEFSHAFCVCAITGFHFAANGEATASSILAVRVGTTVLASLAHLAVLVHGRNRACPVSPPSP